MASVSTHLNGNRPSRPPRPIFSRLRDSMPCQYQVLLDLIRTSETDSGRSLHTVGITSAKRREGATTIACNLALRAACDGLRVLLIDGNRMHPRLQQIFQVPQTPGLSNFMTDSGFNPDCVHDLSSRPFKSLPTALKKSFRRKMAVSRSSRIQESFVAPHLSVLTFGSTNIGTRDFFTSEGHRERLLANLYANFDLVVVDLPTANLTMQCPITASRLDGVIFVLEVEATSDLAAQKSLQRLRLQGARVLGVALNKCRRRWFSWFDDTLRG